MSNRPTEAELRGLPSPAYGGIMLWHENEAQELVFVEYHLRRPFGVVTIHHWDHSKRPWFNPAKDKATGLCMQYFDFEYCRRDEMIYWHESGGGGEHHIVLGTLVNPTNPPSIEFWAAPGMPLFRNAKRKPWNKLPLKQGELATMGYRRLNQPRLLRENYGGKTRNPFEAGYENECVYCRRCNDWFVDEEWRVCEHLYWCNDCGGWYYEDNRMDNDSETHKCKCEADDAG